MKITSCLSTLSLLVGLLFFNAGCRFASDEAAVKSLKESETTSDNIKKYSHTWDEIINNRNLAMFNDSNFSSKVIIHVSPKDLVGIDSAKAYYSNYLTGFSNISFVIKEVIGQGDKLVKYWNFKGKHTGMFFGIPATGKVVNVEGCTLVRMENGKIAEERDFSDNLELMQQLGQIPR